MLYYAGFNISTLFSNDEGIIIALDTFTKIPFPGITDFQIGWSYFLLWMQQELYICKRGQDDDTDMDTKNCLIQISAKPLNRYNA